MGGRGMRDRLTDAALVLCQRFLRLIGMAESDIAALLLDRATRILLRLYGPVHCARVFHSICRVHQGAAEAECRRAAIDMIKAMHEAGALPVVGQA